ncbi:hypothetical protein [Nannocystis bainbridge]|uniref:Uncharacterized protein n=1 Tax=Nannocystis bainbridge TaxID=2995303 RepID=A0ABT5E751_9BACT|nr:hypothetical protein [Nannocystis bainbridge]MDC0721149.1 hypothetical protein [Nannocystis bainbridge]
MATEPAREPSEPTSAEPDACAGIEAPERLAIDVGAGRTSATGLSIRYEGATHDSFEGGAADLLLSLVLSVEGEPVQTWLPSALAKPRYVVFLGHCVRVAAGAAARVEVEVAPLSPGPHLRR